MQQTQPLFAALVTNAPSTFRVCKASRLFWLLLSSLLLTSPLLRAQTTGVASNCQTGDVPSTASKALPLAPKFPSSSLLQPQVHSDVPAKPIVSAYDELAALRVPRIFNFNRLIDSAPRSNNSFGQGACPVPQPQYTFPIEYRAYIPFDHVTGSNSLGCSIYSLTAIYLGDNPYGTVQTDPPTYRASVYSLVTPGSGLNYGLSNTGITYQFDFPSPINENNPGVPAGGYLTPPDFDGIFDDCERENEEGQAMFGISPNTEATTAVSFANTTTVYYNGVVANPLALQALKIGWSVGTTTTVDPNAGTVNVQVNGSVTCFPAHEVLFDGFPVASYIPPTSNSAFIAACLAGPDVPLLLNGVATAPGGVTYAL